MKIFQISGDNRATEMWGPTAGVVVKVDALGSSVDADWLLSNARVGAKEIVDVRQCFNDVSYIYALGNDQGQCAIVLNFVIFIGTKSCRGQHNTKAIADGLKKYVSNRISQKTSAQNITIGNFSTKGWLTSIDIGQFDASRGTCGGTLSFIMQLEK